MFRFTRLAGNLENYQPMKYYEKEEEKEKEHFPIFLLSSPNLTYYFAQFANFAEHSDLPRRTYSIYGLFE